MCGFTCSPEEGDGVEVLEAGASAGAYGSGTCNCQKIKDTQ